MAQGTCTQAYQKAAAYAKTSQMVDGGAATKKVGLGSGIQKEPRTARQTRNSILLEPRRLAPEPQILNPKP